MIKLTRLKINEMKKICSIIVTLLSLTFIVNAQTFDPVSLTENAIPEKLITVYPNPTNGLVHVEIPNQNIQNIKVYDLQGQLIKETNQSQFIFQTTRIGPIL